MSAPTGRAPAGLRPFLPADAPLLAALLAASVLELTGDDYDEDQQEAWAEAAAGDEEAFAARLSRALTLVAERDGEPVGFIALADNRRVDLLYVHPEVAGEGVGSQLLDAVERLAAARGAKLLVAEASDTALGFFQKHGYEPKSRNTVPLGAVWLGNTTVEKPLGEKPAGG